MRVIQHPLDGWGFREGNDGKLEHASLSDSFVDARTELTERSDGLNRFRIIRNRGNLVPDRKEREKNSPARQLQAPVRGIFRPTRNPNSDAEKRKGAEHRADPVRTTKDRRYPA